MLRRYLEVGVSFLKDVLKKVLCRKVVGFDANALYLQCCGLEMPMGFYIDYVCTATGWFCLSFPNNQSVGAFDWLAHIAISRDIHIQHAVNSNKKALGMKKLRVDGWCEETQTAFECDRCYFHGHACITN